MFGLSQFARYLFVHLSGAVYSRHVAGENPPGILIPPGNIS